MSANHTQGPWLAEQGLTPDGKYTSVYYVWTNARDPRYVAEVPLSANARLIAAAPTMLEVLEYVLSDLNSELDYETGVIIRAAIAKAKGE
jgi:hypothetical protein